MRKKMKRLLSFALCLVMVLSMFPQLSVPAMAAGDPNYSFGTTNSGDGWNNRTGLPNACSGRAVVALFFNGDTFPGEPRRHDGANYLKYNTSFERADDNFKASEILQSVLESDSYVMGENSQLFGYYLSATSGIFDPNGLDDEYFTDNFNAALAVHEQDMISDVIAAKKNAGQAVGSENPTDYEIVWYLVKYQTIDSTWHINGLIREKDKYSVLYDGNGATAGSPPDGVIDMSYSAARNYTVQTNADGLSRGNQYNLIGWNTKADGSGIFYSAGQKNVDLTAVGENPITLYAQWAEKNKVNVTWIDGDNKTIHIDADLVSGDQVAIYDGAMPTRLPTNDLTYTFNGTWKDANGNEVTLPITMGNNNITLYAQFDSAPRTYTVTWVNHTVIKTDSGLSYGDEVAYNGAIPTRSTTATEGYLFAGWSATENGAVEYALRDPVTVTGDRTLYAQFTLVPMRTVTWYNEDGSVQLATLRALEGSAVNYPNTTPAKAGNVFAGWATAANGSAVHAPGVSITVSGNMSLYADFEPTKHTVTWKNWDGTALETDSNVLYGATPEYNGATPVRADDVDKTYTFIGWTPAVDTVTGDIVYTATFDEAVRAYTVIWKNYDGSVLKTEQVDYGVTPSYIGATPVCPETATHTHAFVGWTPTIAPIPDNADGTGTIIYTAKYTVIEKLFTATVKVWIDPTINSAGLVTDGTPQNINALSAHDELYLRNLSTGVVSAALNNTDIGVYTISLPHGNYEVVVSDGLGGYTRIIEERIVLPLDGASSDPDSTSADIIFYSVTYNFAGGTFGGNGSEVEYYQRGTDVTVTNHVPVRSQYIFDNWTLDGGAETYVAGQRITVLGGGIIQPHTLTAKWIRVNDQVNINLTIHHHADPALSGAIGMNPHPGSTPINLDLTYRPEGGSGDYWEEGTEYIVNSNWVTVDNTVNKTAGESGLGYATNTTTLTISADTSGFKSLSHAWDYSANILLEDYFLTNREVSETVDPITGDATYTVNATLQYRPDLFNMGYTVEIAQDTIDAGLTPTAVDLKILSYKDGEWSAISRHQSTSLEARFDGSSAPVSGSYGVPVKDQLDNDFYYRVSVVGFTLPDGTELSATGGLVNYSSSATGSTATYKYAAGAYTAVVQVDSTQNAADGAAGIYGVSNGAGGYVQSGTVTVTVYSHAHTVTFDPNGGTLGGNSTPTEVDNQFRIPVLGDYIPSREGNYVFDGWQLNGSAAVTGAPITGDLTLIAKWKSPLTVSGEIRLNTHYIVGDNVVAIPDHDLPQKLTVTLERTTASGDKIIVQVKEISGIDYTTYAANHLGWVEYAFDPVPQDGSAYRVYVAGVNYEEKFLNEPEADTAANITDFSRYDADHTAADADSDNDAAVHIALTFDPADYDLTWRVDSSAIADAFRPESLSILIQCNANDGTPNYANWPVITQHYHGGNYYPKITELTSGTVTDFFPVWQTNANGESYDYAVRVYAWNDGSSTTAYNSATAPFSVTYAPAVAWYEGGQQVTADALENNIVVTLTPKTYTINYDLNAGGDTVTGLAGAPESHKWGSETSGIPTELSRVGYDFLGWTSSVDSAYTDGKISAEAAEDITLTANWSKQKVITFKVVNGTWSDDSTADIVSYVSLNGSGNGSVAIPSGMNAAYGYGNGSWSDPALVGDTLTVSGSDSATYTYSFVRLYHNVGYDTDGADGVDASDSVAHGNYVRVDPADGVWGGDSAVKDVHIEAALDLDNPTRDGYIFAGWYRHYTEDTTSYPGSTVTRRYVAQWLRDENGDRIADNLQKKIIFRIENGTWDGTNSDTIVEFVTLDGSGKADITSVIPTGMQPRTGFVADDAFWSPSMPAGNIVSGNSEVSYTYRHYTTITYSDFTQNGNPEQLLILPGSYIGIDPAGGSWDENTSQTITQINGPYVLEDAVYTNHDFLGWQLNTASGEAAHIFTAQWKKDSYTILWKNDDGNLLETDENVELGTMPEYNGATPTKESTAEFDYTFKGWTPKVVAAEANATYTAEFTATRRNYTVTWKNWDGSVLDTDTVEYGQMPAFAGVPSKPATAEHTYGFTGWTPTVVEVTGDAEYTATYSETTNKYTVTWVDSDGTTVLETDTDVPYGTAPSYDDHSGTTDSLAEAKTLASAGQYTYTFAGWTPSISNVTGSVTYKASYTRTLNAYTVTWVDSDGSTVLETDTDVPYGTMPSYNNTAGTTAALAAAKGDEQYTYAFNGWTPVISEVTGNVIYQATYSQTLNKYTVTWLHSSGATLKTETVSYGDVPTAPADPTRPATSHYTYTFSGWTPAVSAVTGDVIYTAQFTPVQILFTGTVNVHLNNVPINALMDVETLLNGAQMYLGNGEQGHATEYYCLDQSATEAHIYSNSDLPNGGYYVYSSSDGVNFTQLCEQMLTIENNSRSRESHFYSVSYEANGGSGMPAMAYYHKDHTANISATVPTRTGYVFVGWKVNGGEVKQPGAMLTGSITEPYTLVAQWVEAVDIKVNVVIDHTAAGGDTDNSTDKAKYIRLELVGRPGGSSLWDEIAGTVIADVSESGKHDHSFSDDVTTYTANGVTYDGTSLGLRSDWEYSVTARKSGYVLNTSYGSGTGIVKDGNNLTVYLKYAPDTFQLNFSVNAAGSVPAEAVPEYAIVRVLRWNGSDWEYITRHSDSKPGVNVPIGSTASIAVAKEDGNEVYRIEVSSLHYDGGIHALSGSGNVFSDSYYTATVQDVAGGKQPDSGSLYGAYWSGSAQAGTLEAVVSLDLHDISFEENSGSVISDLTDQYKLPDLTAGAYQPTRTGGYVFAGWYTDSAFTAPAVSGKRIDADTTLYAKWIAPMTISGTVSVDGYYMYDHDGNPVTPTQVTPIPAVGRLNTVTVQLQKLTNPVTNYYSTVKEQVITLSYSGTPAVGSNDFSFAEIPDDGSTYRVHVLNHSYAVTYQNENGGGFKPDTDPTEPSIAVDAAPQDSIADVDVKMSFSPDVFDLWYLVDASAIGAGYRPTTAEVLVLCDDDIVNSNSPRLWPVISQMTNNTDPVTYTGDVVNIGTAGSFPAWIKHPNGYLYDYAISLQKVDGADFSGAPYTVEYNGSAQYKTPGVYEDQSQLLTATLKPKSYTVKYYLEHFGANKDIEIHSMTVNSHTWSHETSLKSGGDWIDVPTRAGHIFNGWVDESGNPVTGIPANTTGEVKLYASWKYTISWLNDDGSLINTTSVAYGDMPTHADATKGDTAEYSYTFTGWTPAIELATRNTSYRATFSSAKNGYTVTWENYDGTVLDTDTVEYGEMPSYTGAIPTKDADAQYTYTFNSWTPAVSKVTGDVTYTAAFAQEERHYTITWLNWDGSLLDTDSNLHYNEMPVYSSVAPTKAGNAQHSYIFTGWSPTIVAVTGNAEYTAQFDQIVNTYTVTWNNWNGTLLETDSNVPYGTKPSYNGAEPSRPATAELEYHFFGWDKTIASVTGDVVYTAQYYSTTRTYIVTWKDSDGTTLETDPAVPFGTTPKYDGETPTKAADAQYTYTFDKWSPDVSSVTGNITYTASYSTTVNKYTVTWIDDNGDVLKSEQLEYGATPSFGGTPTKAADAQYTYSFGGWTPSVVDVTENVTYTATYTGTVNKYTVTWVNWDDDVLETDTDVPYGDTPTYNGTDPTPPTIPGHTVTWNQWDKAVSPVTGNTTYKAVFVDEANKYTVVWKNHDGIVLETDSDVPYGAMPSYGGAQPTKTSDAQYSYTHNGWSPALQTVSGNAEYTATFAQTVNSYTITWKNENGDVLRTDHVAYGSTPNYTGTAPTKEATAEFSYTHSGWSPAISPVTGDATYTATYSGAKRSYTIIWQNEDGTELAVDTVEYGTTPSYSGTTPTKASTGRYTYTHSGWAPAVKAVTGNATYKATYTMQTNQYTITWKDDDGSVLRTDSMAYGDTPVYGMELIKAGDAQYSYTFDAWTPYIVAVTGNAEYKATYTQHINKYTVTWKNDGGAVLATEQVEYGMVPTYTGTPTKAADAQYTYTFAAWDNTPVAVTGDVTYTATYSKTVNKYTVIWVNWDDTVLETDLDVPYGTTPTYDGADPTRPDTTEHVFTWNLWNPVVAPVTGDVTYKAIFVDAANTYTVVWKNHDGTVLETDTGVPYGDMPSYDGETPTKTGDAQYSYAHNGWTPAVQTVAGNAEYTATFTQTVNSYTVTYTDGVDGTEVFADQVYAEEYGTPMPVFVGTPARAGYTFGGWTPAVSDTVTGDVVYTAQWTANAPVIPVVPPASTTGTAKLVKVDADDQSSYLKNVVFELYKADGTLLGEFKTDANGQIIVSSLASGEYYWLETRPAEGYVLDSTKHSFTVSAGQTATLTVINKHSEVPSAFSGDHYAYIVGYSDGKVHPEANITRAEVATIFFRLLDDETRERYLTKENTFSDVENGMWFNTAVSTMAAMGIINGYPDGDFHPNANITRAEFAAIAARFDSNANTTGVSFTDIYGHWAQKEINIAANNGWILGYENGEFRPNQNITRAEAMAMVNRVLQRIPESKDDLLDAMVKWSDNMDTTKWYYLTVQEATNSHDYGRKNNGYEYWTKITEVPDWAALER